MILGIFYLNGQPVTSRQLKQIQLQLNDQPHEKAVNWHHGSVSLGQLPHISLSEANNDNQLFIDNTSRFVLVSRSRLDNRNELCHSLQIPLASKNAISDYALILKAYQKWGKDCPKYLLGDWAFAVWDSKKQQLFLARDHFGPTSLFYYHDNNCFAFANTLNSLLSLPSIPCQLDPAGLESTTLRRDGTTPYRNIHQLTPAQALLVSKNRIDRWHYWCLEDVSPIRFRTDQDYQDALLEIYTEAVKCRLQSEKKIGLFLSGGLDSSSIASVAAPELATKGKKLFAYSGYPQYNVESIISSNQQADERAEVKAISQMVGNIDVTYGCGSNISQLMGLKKLLECSALPWNSPNAPWMIDLLSKAKENEVGVILDGVGGNFTLSWNGNRNKLLTQLLLTGQWATFKYELLASKEIHQHSWKQSIVKDLLLPWTPPIWKKRYQRFKHRDKHLINDHVIQSLKQNPSSFGINPKATNFINPGLYQTFLRGKNDFLLSLGNSYGIEFRQPMLDKRLVEFCLGLPQDQFIRNGHERVLIRKAMTERLPNAIIWPRQRGIQGADLILRMLETRIEIADLLQIFQHSNIVCECLNLSKLNNHFQTITTKPNSSSSLEAGALLLKGLSIGMFLNRFEVNH